MDAQIENIIRYLDSEMPETERITFEEKMRNDEVLSKEVAFQRGLHGFLDRQKPDLELDLDSLGDEFILNQTEKKRGFPLWLVLSILLLVGVIVYFSFFNKNETTTNNNSTQIEAPQQPTPSETEENTTTPIEDSKENNSTPTQSNQPEQLPNNQPIATVDKNIFERHSTMESIIQDIYRNDDVSNSTTVSFPQPDAVFSYKENISFIVDGETIVQPNYRLIVYSNRAYDIENDYRLLNVSLRGQAQNNKYSFRFNGEVPLKKGLYYLVIRKDDSREVLHISRFTVE